MTRTCAECRYWLAAVAIANDAPVQPAPVGLCRRFPPVDQAAPDGLHAMFPKTFHDTWCGEWRTKEAPPNGNPKELKPEPRN